MEKKTLAAIYAGTAALAIYAALVISTYYAGTSHSEAYSKELFGYLFLVLVTYGGTRLFSMRSGKSEISFSPVSIAGWALLNLVFVVFSFGGNGNFVLLGKILLFSLLPLFIVFVSAAFGRWALERLAGGFAEYAKETRLVASISFGLSVFIFTVASLSATFGYSLSTTVLPLLVMAAVSYREAIKICKSLLDPVAKFDNYASGKPILPLFSTELAFFVFSMVLAVNLVNIVRPMPIGWDDLGVYMNYPKMMADTGEIGKLGMVAWQSITGIGFLFHSATQAFFLNQIGGVLSVLFVTLAVSRIAGNGSSQKPRINLALVSAVAMYALPMIVFQQAKDMKVDPALFSMSVAAVFMLYEFLRGKPELTKQSVRFLCVMGFIAGTAFAIKATTVMLVLGAGAAIFYAFVGLSGFYAFFALFIAAFTKFRLWDLLNVNYPKDDPGLLNTVSIVALAAFGILMAYAVGFRKRTVSVSKAFASLAVFAIAAGAALLPWMGKNVYETRAAGASLSVATLLSGYGYVTPADPKKARTPEELETIEKKFEGAGLSSKGKTTDEDLGRYFGYEDGINNYLKLPFNLTYQKNQPGEYTEISFLFLAFVPLAFVFLRFTKVWLAVVPALATALLAAYYFFAPTSAAFSAWFSQFLLPGGYLAIAALLLSPLAFFHVALDRKEPRNEIFLTNLAFLSLYVFVFVIAAYGIVWYGIALYFCLLLAISLAISESVTADSANEPSETAFAKNSVAVVSLAVFATYFFNSAVPHAWANLKNAGFEDYKAGRLAQDEAVFAAHPDYLQILATLNLKEPKKHTERVIANLPDEKTKNVVISNIGASPEPEELNSILMQLGNTRPGSVQGLPDSAVITMQENARIGKNALYSDILYPSKEERNQGTIYRIGTFLTYFISQNRQRYFDDSLVQGFDKYVYDENIDVTVDRLKKIGIKYFLIDLNAATIDRDPRHDLTRRFEGLLKTFRSDKLKLIKTDSLCLSAAIALQKRGGKLEEYMTLAGVNYESYGEGGTVYRGQKLAACQKYLVDLIRSWAAKSPGNEYLTPLARYVENTTKGRKDVTEEELFKIVRSAVSHGWVALFEVQ